MKRIKFLFVMVVAIFLSTNIVKAETVSFKVGDYVKMTPTSNLYSVPSSLTGHTSDQAINPSELNTWRVIRVNNDGTVDMISEYTSSTEVVFKGKTGYQNFVGALNTIAKQYENSTYTVGSRYIGYNGQTEYITDTSALDATNYNNVEAQGGGDYLYENDIKLVTDALKTLKASDVEKGYSTSYWLASRHYNYNSSTSFIYYGRLISSGAIESSSLYYYGTGNKFYDNSNSSYIRPIVTLKSGLTISGTGTSSEPFTLTVPNEEVQSPEINNNTENNTNNNEENNTNNNEENNTNNNEESDSLNSEIDNPQTGLTLPIVFMIVGVIAAIVIYYFTKKKNKLKRI